MDGKLEVHRRRDFSVQWVFSSLGHRQHESAYYLSAHKVDQTIWTVSSAAFGTCLSATPRPSGTADISSSHTNLYHDNYTLLRCRWHAMCQKPALPILCIHCLGYPIFALEIWTAPNLDIRHMGNPGMGMECVPEHGCQLGSRCCLSSRASCWGLVGYKN